MMRSRRLCLFRRVCAIYILPSALPAGYHTDCNIGCDTPRGESVTSLHSGQGSPQADDDDGYQLIELGDGHVLVEFSDGSLKNPNNWSTVRDIPPNLPTHH